jgi:hypothetical protein
MLRATAAVGAAAFAFAAAAAALGPRAEGRPLQRSVCVGDIKATIAGGVVRYCGKARAHISVFPRTTFRGGSCTVQQRFNFPMLTVYIGQRTLNRTTNKGRSFFSLRISGNPPRLSSMDVVAYAKGKRWTGIGVAFKLKAGHGTFVAKGTAPSHGKARGTFVC